MQVMVGATKVGETKHHQCVVKESMDIHFHETFEVELAPALANGTGGLGGTGSTKVKIR
jgi:hypothetical protein